MTILNKDILRLKYVVSTNKGFQGRCNNEEKVKANQKLRDELKAVIHNLTMMMQMATKKMNERGKNDN